MIAILSVVHVALLVIAIHALRNDRVDYATYFLALSIMLVVYATSMRIEEKIVESCTQEIEKAEAPR